MTSPKDDLRSSDSIARRIAEAKAEAERLVRVEASVDAVRLSISGVRELLGTMDKKLDKKFDETDEKLEAAEADIKRLSGRIYFFSGVIAALSFLGEWIFHRLTGSK